MAPGQRRLSKKVLAFSGACLVLLAAFVRIPAHAHADHRLCQPSRPVARARRIFARAHTGHAVRVRYPVAEPHPDEMRGWRDNLGMENEELTVERLNVRIAGELELCLAAGARVTGLPLEQLRCLVVGRWSVLLAALARTSSTSLRHATQLRHAVSGR